MEEFKDVDGMIGEVPKEIQGGGAKPRGRKKGYKRSPEEIAKMLETRSKNRLSQTQKEGGG